RRDARRRGRTASEHVEEVAKQVEAAFARDRLRMELDAPDRMCPMPDGLDLVFEPGFVRAGDDLELIGHAGGIDDQRMVSRDREWRWKPLEDPRPGVADGGGLSVHQALGTDDLAAVRG